MIPGLVQWVKDLGDAAVGYRSQLQLGFNPWPRNFHWLKVQPKKKKKEKEKNLFIIITHFKKL